MERDENKDERIFKFIVQVSEEEQERILRKAQRRGLSGPSFLRMLGLLADEPQPQPQ